MEIMKQHNLEVAVMNEKKIPMKDLPNIVKTVLVSLQCKNLPEDERKKGVGLASVADAIDALEIVKAEYIDEYKEQKNELLMKAKLLRDEIRQGFDLRMIECTKTYNWNDGTVTVVRMDSELVHSKRGMTDEERQMKMDLGDEEGGSDD